MHFFKKKVYMKCVQYFLTSFFLSNFFFFTIHTQQYIFAPWRDHYISTSKPASQVNQCPLCGKLEHSDQDSFILTRTKHYFVILNLFPYVKGHILIIPYAHVPDMSYLSESARIELIELINDCSLALKDILHYQGLNIGINVGKIAGASVPDHLHVHVVPRFDAEMNSFMQVIANTKEIPWDLKKLYAELKPAFEQLETRRKIV